MKMLPIPLSLGGPPLDLWNNVLWRYPPAPPSPLAELKTQLPPQLPPDPRLWNRNDVTVFLRFCEREFDLPKFELDLFQMNGKALCLLNRTDFGERCPGAGDVLHNVLQMLIRESQMMHRHLPNSPVTPTSRYPLSPHSQPPTPNWAQLAPPESPFHNAHIHHFMQPNSVTLSPAPSIDSQASSPPQGNSQEQQQQQHQQQQQLNASSSSSTSSSSSSISSLISGSGMNGTNSNNGVNSLMQQQQQQQQQNNVFSSNNSNGTISNNISQINPTSSSSNQSDSDDENFNNSNNNNNSNNSTLPTSTTSNGNVSTTTINNNSQNVKHNNHHLHHQQQLPMQSSPPPTPTFLKDVKPSLSQQLTNVMNSWSQQNHSLQIKNENTNGVGNGGSVSAPTTPGYMPVKREFFPDTPEPNTNGRLLWDFLQQLLNDPAQRYSNYIAWKCRDTGVFKIVDPAGLAKLWGIQKNHLSMNYDKMSRALRYYYRVNILRKVQGERHCYQFLRNPSELKNIKNISLLRQSVANSTSNIPSSPSVPQSQTGNGQSNSHNKLIDSHSNTQQTTNQHHHQQQQQQQQQQHHNTANSDSRHSPIQMAQSSPHHLSAAAVHHHHQQLIQQQQQQQQNGTNNNNQLGLPNLSQISSTSPVGGYGQPPTSPHLLHAIQGAFFATLATQQQQQQQQTGQYQPPHSPVLPPTPSEKLQFSSLKIESNSNDANDDIQPTDLSVSNGERKWNDNYNNFADCYPLIRNSDGCTTIKLIRYQENGSPSPTDRSSVAATTTTTTTGTSASSSSSPSNGSNTSTLQQPHSPTGSNGDNRLHSTTSNSSRHSPSLSPHSNTSEDVNVDEMPTDLSK